jgi:pimeloyl-[acyl-carrier protein] methyl ester esterase
MPRVATAGLELHYEDAGLGAPVILVHGWSLSSAAFAEEIAVLSRTSRAIAPDLRGHGRSAGTAFGLEDLAHDVSALASALSLERAVVVGWSLGAQVALAALPLLGRRAAALVLVGGTPRFTLGDGWAHGVPARSVDVLAHRVRRDAARAAARFFDGMFVEGELDDEGRRRADRVLAAVPPPDPAAALAGLEILAREDLRPGLATVDVPTLLVHGALDPICPVGASRAMADAIPSSRLAVVQGAGHAPFVSRPAAFRDALGSFLREIA